MPLFMNWRGAGTDQSLYESQFTVPTDDPPFASAGRLPDRGSLTGPALATYQGERYMAWRGIAGDQGLYYATADGGGWTDQIHLGDRASANSPALATFHGTLYMAWRGTGDDQGLYWATYPVVDRDPPWSDQHAFGDRGSVRGPSLAVFDGQLFMAWRGILGDQNLWWSTFDGSQWSPQHQLADRASVDAPFLVALGDRLLMYWRGGSSLDESDLRLYVSEYQGGESWSPQQRVVNTAGHEVPSDSRPGITAYNSELWFASVGGIAFFPVGNPEGGDDGGSDPGNGMEAAPEDPRIYVETFDGVSVVGHVPTPQQTDYQPGLCRYQNDHYAGLWQQQGGPAWQARHNLTADEYQQAFDQLGGQGYRLLHVSGHEVDGMDRYAAIWELSSGPAWQARHRLTADQYQQTFDDLGSQGYVLVNVSGYTIDGEDHYAAIWQQASATWQARHRLTADEYQETFDQLGSQGYRLVDVSGYCVAGQDLYAAIWVQAGGPAWVARHRLTADEYQQAFDDLGSQGFRLVHVAGYNVNGQDRYAGIWVQEGGPAWVGRHNLTPDEYQQAFDDLGSQGYRLIDVSGF